MSKSKEKMGRATTTVSNGSKPSGNGLRVSKPIQKTAASNGKARPPTTSTSQGGTKAGGEPGGKSDRSQLNFPYDVRLNGYSSLQKAVANGTPKIRRILMEECDYVLECRVCRNLFRSLPNFITHKLNYCKKAFDSTWCIGLSNLIQTSDITYNIEYEADPSLLLDESFNDSMDNNRSVTDLYNEIATRAQKRSSNSTTTAQSQSSASVNDESCVRLQLKPLNNTAVGSTIALQQVVTSNPSNCDINSTHTNFFETAKKDTAILGPDGRVMYSGTLKKIDAIASKLSAKLQEDEKKARTAANCVRPPGTHNNGSSSSQTTKPYLNKPGNRTSPLKTKRTLSPVKRIKMKYSKLESYNPSCAGAAAANENQLLSCKRCSVSFNTKHEMSMHLALCTGVINYAFLKDDRPQPEKIRISARNDFAKPSFDSKTESLSLPNGLRTPKKLVMEPNLELKISGAEVSPDIITPLSATIPTTKKRNVRKLVQSDSGKSEESAPFKQNGKAMEVNNNKQIKSQKKPTEEVSNTHDPNSQQNGLGEENNIICESNHNEATITSKITDSSNNKLVSLDNNVSEVVQIKFGSDSTTIVDSMLATKKKKASTALQSAKSKKTTNNNVEIKGKLPTSPTGDGKLKDKPKTFNLRTSAASLQSRIRKSKRKIVSRIRLNEPKKKNIKGLIIQKR